MFSKFDEIYKPANPRRSSKISLKGAIPRYITIKSVKPGDRQKTY